MENTKKSRAKPFIVQFADSSVAQYVKGRLDTEKFFSNVRVTVSTNGKAFFHTDGDHRKNEQIRKYLKDLIAFSEA